MLRRMRFMMALPIALFLVLLGFGGTASAAPKWVPLTAQDSVITPGQSGLTFPIYDHVIKFNERLTTTYEPDGTTVWTIEGVSTASLTNMNDPSKTIVVNLSGPVTETLTPAGVFTEDFRGPTLFFTGGLNGAPPVIVSKGHVQISVDETTTPPTILSVSSTGTYVDVGVALS